MSKWDEFINRLLCSHHWHAEVDSHRKVPTRITYCMDATPEHKKYISFGEYGFKEITIKFIKRCCICKKRKIATEIVEANIPSHRERALSYPDINDEPLTLE